MPWAITLPWSITAMSSARRSASSRYWVVSSTVVPSSTSSSIIAHRSSRLRGSRPVVGSSRKSTGGLATSAAARSRRRRMPPEYFFTTRVGGVGQREALQEFGGAALGLGALHAVEAPHHHQVLGAGQALVDRGVLAGQADPLAQLGRLAHGVDTRHLDLALGGALERGQHSNRGGLAGAVGAEQAEHRAGADLEVHAVHGAHVAVDLDQARDADRGLPAAGDVLACGHSVRILDRRGEWHTGNRTIGLGQDVAAIRGMV